MTLIALAGAAPSGKLWVAARLVQNHGFTLVRFSDPIKRALCEALNLSPDLFEGDAKGQPLPEYGGVTPLQMMQGIGFHGGRRAIHEDVWLPPYRAAVAAAGDRVVTDDLRWPNEEAAVRDLGGVLWEVERPKFASNEKACRGLTLDHRIENASTIAALLEKTDRDLEKHLARSPAPIATKE